MARYVRVDDDSFWDRAPDGYSLILEAQRAMGGRASMFVMGDWVQDAPTVLVLELAPGEGVNQHAHPCYRFEVVVRGTLEVEDGQVLVPGDVMVAEPGEMYGPHVAGPGGATTFEIFSRFAGVHSLIYETPEGRFDVDASDPDGPRPTVIIGAKPTSRFASPSTAPTTHDDPIGSSSE